MKKNRNILRKIVKTLIAFALIVSFVVPANFAAAEKKSLKELKKYVYFNSSVYWCYMYNGKEEWLTNKARKVLDKIIKEKNHEYVDGRIQEEKKKLEDSIKNKTYYDPWNFLNFRINDWENYYLRWDEEGLFGTLEYLRSDECEKQWIENCKTATIGYETPHQVGNPKSTSGKFGTFLYKGDSFDLMIKGGSGSYTYKSAKKSVATVSDSGIVKAVSKGVAPIDIYDTVTTRTKTFYVDVRDKSQKKTDDVRLKIYDALYKWKTSVSFPKKTYSKSFVFKAMTEKDIKKVGTKYLKGTDYYDNIKLVDNKIMYGNLPPEKAASIECKLIGNFELLNGDSLYNNSLHFNIKETKKNIVVTWKFPKGTKERFTTAKKLAEKCIGQSPVETMLRLSDIPGSLGRMHNMLTYLSAGLIPYGFNNVYFDGIWINMPSRHLISAERGSLIKSKTYKIYSSELDGAILTFDDSDTTKYGPYYISEARKDFIKKRIEIPLTYSENFNYDCRYNKYPQKIYYIKKGLKTYAELFPNIYNEENTYASRSYTKKGYIDLIKESGLYPDYVNPIQRDYDKYHYLNSLATQG